MIKRFYGFHSELIAKTDALFRPIARLFESNQVSTLGLGRWCIILIAAVLVTIRVFTETWAVLPRYLNVVEFALIPLLVSYVLFVRVVKTGLIRILNIELWLGVFGVVWLLSSLLNAPDILVSAAVLFMAGHILPILFALAIVNVNPGPAFATRVFRLLRRLALVGVAFGLTQLPQVVHDPDAVVLTFGINQNQAAFFLSLVITWLAAQWFCGLAKLADKVLLCVLVPLFFLAGFKILWALFPLSLIVTVAIVSVKRFRLTAQIIVPVAILIGLSVIVVKFVPYPEIELFARFATFDPYKLGKVQVILRLKEIWLTRPWGALIGVGPGTFSSQAFTTFADIGSSGGIGYVTNSGLEASYMTDIAKQYMLPYLRLGEFELGSSVVSRPTASIISLLVETGLIGFFSMLAVYLSTLQRLLRYARQAANPQALAISLTAAVGLLTLLLISTLDNYLEVTRLTSLVWLLVGLAIGIARRDSSADLRTPAL